MTLFIMLEDKMSDYVISNFCELYNFEAFFIIGLQVTFRRCYNS